MASHLRVLRAPAAARLHDCHCETMARERRYSSAAAVWRFCRRHGWLLWRLCVQTRAGCEVAAASYGCIRVTPLHPSPLTESG